MRRHLGSCRALSLTLIWHSLWLGLGILSGSYWAFSLALIRHFHLHFLWPYWGFVSGPVEAFSLALVG